ncbi:MAG: glycosyltransferase family 2 protein [Gemmatimonadaceae bacterium]
MSSVGVTVVIAARNEAANIAACIDSVRWARQIIVVEDGSSDDTASVATAVGALVLPNPFVTIGLQRNAAIERAESDWILVIDADERGSMALGEELTTILGAPRFNAYRIPRTNFFLGREVKHGGWESDRPVRLFRSSLRYNADRVHEHVVTDGGVGDLKSPIAHEPYASLGSWFEKLGRYSRHWAEDRHDRGMRGGVGAVLVRPPLRFLTMYIVRGGWMDGARGAVLASMAATSVMAKYAWLWALGLTEAAGD